MLTPKAATLVLISFLAPMLVWSCAFGGGEGGEGEEEGGEAVPLSEFFLTLEPRTPTPRPTVANRADVLSLTPTPVAQNMDDARKLVWSYLGQCFSLDPDQLDANQVRGDWFVKVSGEVSPLEYGLWKVDSLTGSLDPQDPLGRNIEAYVKSQCKRDLRPKSFDPTPHTHPGPYVYCCTYSYTRGPEGRAGPQSGVGVPGYMRRLVCGGSGALSGEGRLVCANIQRFPGTIRPLAG